MTVTTATYQPVVIPLESGVETYDFELEIIGADAFELWFIDADDNRTLASTDVYTVAFNGPPPIYDSGSVSLTRPAPEGTITLSIERNTPITQLVDFKAHEAFPVNLMEFVFDKHMMICQEIAYRKCDAEIGDLEMTQLIDYEPYKPLRANEVQFSVQNLIDILLAIATSAESCRDRPEET